MANSYYVFTPAFVPGTKVRSDEMNLQLAGVEAGFDLLPADATALTRGTNIFAATSGGTANTYTATMGDTRTSNQDGDRLIFEVAATNTGASTLNVDTIGPISIVRPDGSALVAGDLVAGLFYEVLFDSTNNRFQMMTVSSAFLTDLNNRVTWAGEWANKAEDSLVSSAAGGDLVDDYSALHWANKANADAVLTAADAVSTAADVVSSGNNVSYAAEWANKAEDSLISAAAGGDQIDDYSALHWANKAAAAAAGLNIPSIGAGDALKYLRANAGETAYELVFLPVASDTAQGVIELATQAEVDTGTDTGRAVTPATLANWSGLYVLPAASTTVVGGAELATQAEVDAGTDALRIVTPATLAAYSGLTLPAGANHNIQFNNAGALDGDANFLWDDATRTLSILSGAVDQINFYHTGAAGFITTNNDDITLRPGSNTVEIKDTLIVQNTSTGDATATVKSGGGTAVARLKIDGAATSNLEFLDEGVLESRVFINASHNLVFETDNPVNANTLTFENNGTLSVAPGGGVNYEDLVTADDDIPNKKYVDDADQVVVSNVRTSSATRGTATISEDTEFTITLPVIGIYQVEFFIRWDETANNTGLALQIDYTGTNTTLDRFQALTSKSNLSTGLILSYLMDEGVTQNHLVNDASSQQITTLRGVLEATTTGNLRILWSRVNPGGSGTTVSMGYLKATKIG